MHILVLGSGVIGTSVAYFLARAGQQVTVLDRQAAPAMETSYANAGQVSPGYSAPWAAPGLPWKALRWLAMRHGPLVVQPSLDPALWRWSLALLGQCSAARYEINKSRMVRLAEYSRDVLRSLRTELDLHYDERALGTLQLLRTEAQHAAILKDMAVLERAGVAHEWLDRAGIVAAEPALAGVAEQFVGGLRLPGDETGDCHLYTRRLAEHARALGVDFRFGVTLQGFDADSDGVQGVRTDAGLLRADAYVLALGSHSAPWARPLGLKLPVYPVKGYSLTLPVERPEAAPLSTVMDETYKVAITRLGSRLRVGGTAQLSGYDLSLPASRRETLAFVLRGLFPEAGDPSRAEFWTGLRPMTPDGTPLVGPSPVRRLWLATGHGTLGWTMAAGTGALLADWMLDRRPAIDVEGLAYGRDVSA